MPLNCLNKKYITKNNTEDWNELVTVMCGKL